MNDWTVMYPYDTLFAKWANLTSLVEKLNDIIDYDKDTITIIYNTPDGSTINVTVTAEFIADSVNFLRDTLGNMLEKEWSHQHLREMNYIWNKLQLKYMPNINKIIII